VTQNWADIGTAACAVLLTENAADKAEIARHVAAAWRTGSLAFSFKASPPERPARPEHPIMMQPADMPKRRKAGTDANRRALLHAVAHIELNAIDLAFDIIARFGGTMPRNFTDDWISVGDDESRHFSLVSERLKASDSYYGDLPAHDGLWQSSQDTAANLAARLAIVPMVLEARGLDVTPSMIAQFRRVGDDASADVLQVIYNDEIGHVATGSRWFKFLANQTNQNPETWFHNLVSEYFRGYLKPPFNENARDKAGMPNTFYLPLTAPSKADQAEHKK
jgi:uncharacterized ferritin-like protein (DUF455 family)